MLKRIVTPIICIMTLLSSCKKEAEQNGIVFHISSTAEMNIRIQIREQPDWPVKQIVESGKTMYDYSLKSLRKESQVDILVTTLTNNAIEGSLRLKGHDVPYANMSLNDGIGSVKSWQATAP